MKEIGFVTALVLIICGMVYWSRHATGIDQDATNKTTYESAISAAKNVKSAADADTRRRWVTSLQLTAAGDMAYSAEGDNAAVLVVTSNDADNASCSAFASGEHGSAASAVGFTQVDCHNGSNGAVYKIPLALTR